MLNTLRPPALPLDALQAFAERSYGLSGVWSPLEGERDQNYRVLGAGGVSATFKVCHPAEGDAILECQATALEHIAEADPALPVPRLMRTRNGEPLARITHDGQHYPVMVLSWLEGHVLGGDTLGRDGLFDLGKLLARLGVALRGFVNGAPAERDLVWDTRHVLRLASEIGNLPEGDRALATEILARHETVTVPALRRMRAQVIHGDVHPHNVLVDAARKVTGIIDFGDMVHGPLILDLANATGDFLTPAADVPDTIFELVRGYRSVTPLEEAEGYRRLIEDFAHTQEDAARLAGKSRSHIANTIRLLQLPEQVKAWVRDGKLTAGHARTLLGTPDPVAAARDLIEGALSVRQAEQRAPAKKKPGAKPYKDPNIADMEASISNRLGLKIQILHKGEKGGEVRISYRTLEQLDDLERRLKN